MASTQTTRSDGKAVLHYFDAVQLTRSNSLKDIRQMADFVIDRQTESVERTLDAPDKDRLRAQIREFKKITLGDSKDVVTMDPMVIYPKEYKDTSIGGCDVINPLPQPCRNDDVVWPALGSRQGDDPDGRYGMGRLYSETYEETQQIVEFTFGTIRYKGILPFLLGSTSRRWSNILRGDDLSIGTLLKGFFVDPLILSVSLPFVALKFGLEQITGENRSMVSKYCEFRSSMFLYQRAVNSILRPLASTMGIIPQHTTEEDRETDADWDLDKEHAQWKADKNLPEVARLNFDIIEILNKRSARISQALNVKNASRDIGDRQLLKLMKESAEEGDGVVSGLSMEKMKKYNELYSEAYKENKHVFDKAKSEEDREEQQSLIKATNKNIWESVKGLIEGVSASYVGFRGQGLNSTNFVRFRVNKSMNTTETFSNELGESAIGQKLNAVADQGRAQSDVVSGIAGDNWIGKMGNFFSSLLAAAKHNMLPFGGIDVLSRGDAKIEVPKVWMGSSLSRSYNLTISLRSPYGDPISIFQNIMVPLAMLMAAGMPRQAGSHHYTSPFYLRGCCRGQFSIPLGMITSLTIKRGAEEYGWTKNGLPVAVDVDLTIDDLTPIMFMGIYDKTGIFQRIFNDNVGFQEYLNMLGGMSAYEQFSIKHQRKHRSRIWWSLMKLKWTQAHYVKTRVNMSSFGQFLSTVSSPWGHHNEKEYASRRSTRDR